MSIVGKSDSVYEPYDPELEFSHSAKNTTAVYTNDPIRSAGTSAYSVVKGSAATGTPPFPLHLSEPEDKELYGVLSNVRTESFFRLDTRYLRSIEGLVRLASLVS